MSTYRTYTADDKMIELICENYHLLLVMSRFGLSMGFGDKTVKEVCEAHTVDSKTFLAIVNFLQEGHNQIIDSPEQLSVQSLMDYLKQSHLYFLNFNLPTIRRKLMEAIDCSREDGIAYLILKFYDEYVHEVRRHMEYEDKYVFTYVNELLAGHKRENYKIEVFSRKHTQIEEKLSELKNIIIKYYNADASNLLNAALFDIFTCEEELLSHNMVEDYLFVPAVLHLENQIIVNQEEDGKKGGSE